MQQTKASSSHHVVVHDPTGEFWEGAIVSATQGGAIRASSNAVTLPIEPSLMSRSAVGGYFRRSWGSGWPLDGAIPKTCCPMLLHVLRDSGCRVITCAVRLVPTERGLLEKVRGGTRLTGSLRIVGDNTQVNAPAGGFSATKDTNIEAAVLGMPDAEDGWTVYLGGLEDPAADAMLGLSLYGVIPGTSVAWAAVAQSA